MDKEKIKELLQLNKKKQKQVLSTGSITIDEYLGGIYSNRIIGIGGNFSTGKTTLTIQIAKKYLETSDKCILYIDTEHSLAKEYLDNLKVNQDRFIYCEESDLQKIKFFIQETIQSKLFGLIIVDSISGCENDNLYNQIIKFYTEIQSILLDNKITMICIEQDDIYQNNTLLIKNRYKKLLYFYSQYIGLYKVSSNEKDTQIKLSAIKNKLNNKIGIIKITLDHKQGFI